MFIVNVGEQWINEGMHPIPNNDSILIQITSPFSKHVSSPFMHDFNQIYRFKFDDISEHHIEIIKNLKDDKILKEIKIIDDKQALSIAEALIYAKNNNLNVIINCQAGISRSAAIAEIACELLGFEDKKEESCLRHSNNLVKKMVGHYIQKIIA